MDVHSVEGLAEVQGDNDGALGRSRLVEASSYLICELEEGCGCGVKGLETVLVFDLGYVVCDER